MRATRPKSRPSHTAIKQQIFRAGCLRHVDSRCQRSSADARMRRTFCAQVCKKSCAELHQLPLAIDERQLHESEVFHGLNYAPYAQCSESIMSRNDAGHEGAEECRQRQKLQFSTQPASSRFSPTHWKEREFELYRRFWSRWSQSSGIGRRAMVPRMDEWVRRPNWSGLEAEEGGAGPNHAFAAV